MRPLLDYLGWVGWEDFGCESEMGGFGLVGWVPLLMHQKLELAQLVLQQKPDPLQQQPQVELELPQVELQQVGDLVWPFWGWDCLFNGLFLLAISIFPLTLFLSICSNILATRVSGLASSPSVDTWP